MSSFSYQDELINHICKNEPLDTLSAEIIPAGTIASAEEALELHQRHYWNSLIDVMVSTFNKVRKAAGEEIFNELATDYISENPSKTYDINIYGRSFPFFLKNISERLSQIAHFELICDDVEQLKQHVAVSRGQLLRLQNPNYKVMLASTLAFFESEYSVLDILNPEPKKEFVIIYQKESRVQSRQITREQFLFLRDLRQTRSVAQSLERVENLTQESVQSVFHILSSENLIESIIE